MKFIETLNHEHRQILTLLKKISRSPLNSETREQKYRELKTLLLEHLKKEDSDLYPALREKGKESPEVGKTVEVFSKNMQLISEFVFDFFERFLEKGEKELDTWYFEKMKATLEERIRREETGLYPEFEKTGAIV